MSEITRQFLSQVEPSLPAGRREDAVSTVRAVFRALMSEPGRAELEEFRTLLPEDLETLWKPAFYTCLRKQDAGEGGTNGAGLTARVRSEMPDLSPEEAREVARAVVDGLRPHLTVEQETRLEAFLPDATPLG